MDNIIKKQGDNIGGVRDILFLAMDKVTSIPAPDELGMIDSSALEITQDGWNIFAFTPETGFYKEEQENVPGGVLYKTTVEMLVAKDSLNRYLTFFDMEFHEFLLLVRDNNGVSRLVGGIDKDGTKYGMKFKTEVLTNDARTGFNRNNCQFYMEGRFKPRIAFNIQDLEFLPEPPHYTGEEAVEILPPSE